MGVGEINNEKATLAGGCFWCMVAPFEKLSGVVSVVAGYVGGTGENPSYQDYAKKGYVEAIQVEFDPQKVSYSAVLDLFWRQIDPTDQGGQFADRGPHYRTAIFYHTPEQKKEAELSKERLNASGKFGKKIVTEIIPYTNFYLAEQYHQQFYKKNPEHYKSYAQNSGREQFLKKMWDGKASELQKTLTPLQYDVIKCGGTEPAFNNEYWNNKEPGIYVDRVSGEPLFSSLDKYDSGTGWPSFVKPLEPNNIQEREDNSLAMARTEIVSAKGESHLGHVFPDGPQPIGLRYCMNSAALRFIPVKDLEKEGYGAYLPLFKE